MSPPYERLKAWQKSHHLVLAVYRETRRWPEEERYGLISQIRRASVSAGTNLAEGSARFGGRELRRFANIALGSLAEVSYLLRTARDLGYFESDEWARLTHMRDSAAGLVFLLARSLGGPPGDS
jgi:four helix bundle protein